MSILRVAEMLSRAREALKWLVGNVFETLAVLFFVGFFAAILLQVFARYVVHYPIQWTEEFSRLLYVGMVCLGAAAAVDDHSRLTIGLDFLKKRSLPAYRVLTVIIDVVTLVVLYYIFLGSYSRTVRGWINVLPATGLRWSYFYVPFIIASAMLFVYTAMRLAVTTLRLGQGKEGVE